VTRSDSISTTSSAGERRGRGCICAICYIAIVCMGCNSSLGYKNICFILRAWVWVGDEYSLCIDTASMGNEVWAVKGGGGGDTTIDKGIKLT